MTAVETEVDEKEELDDKYTHAVCAHCRTLLNAGEPVYAACGKRMDRDGALPPTRNHKKLTCPGCQSAIRGLWCKSNALLAIFTRCDVCPQKPFEIR